MNPQKNYYKKEIVTLKYPFSIAKIFPKEIKSTGAFSNYNKTVYNVESFSSVKFECTQLGQKLTTEYPEYQYNIYAWRAIAMDLKEDKMVHRLRFNMSFSDKKKAIYVDVDLLPEEVIIPKVNDETFEVDELSAGEKKALVSLFKALAEKEDSEEEDATTEDIQIMPETPKLTPHKLQREYVESE